MALTLKKKPLTNRGRKVVAPRKPRKVTPKPKAKKKPAKKNIEWTEGRKKTFITTVLRGGMRRWPPKWETLKAASIGKKINKNSGRMAEHYKCAGCEEEFTAKEVQVDHIDPCVDPKVGFVNWDTFIQRLYCAKENLQVLCSTCHAKKTQIERESK